MVLCLLIKSYCLCGHLTKNDPSTWKMQTGAHKRGLKPQIFREKRGEIITLPALQKSFVNIFSVFAWEFCIEKWRGFFGWIFSGLRLPRSEARKVLEKFGENSGQNSGRKFEKFGKLSFCNFPDLRNQLWKIGPFRGWLGHFQGLFGPFFAGSIGTNSSAPHSHGGRAEIAPKAVAACGMLGDAPEQFASRYVWRHSTNPKVVQGKLRRRAAVCTAGRTSGATSEKLRGFWSKLLRSCPKIRCVWWFPHKSNFWEVGGQLLKITPETPHKVLRRPSIRSPCGGYCFASSENCPHCFINFNGGVCSNTPFSTLCLDQLSVVQDEFYIQRCLNTSGSSFGGLLLEQTFVGTLRPSLKRGQTCTFQTCTLFSARFLVLTTSRLPSMPSSPPPLLSIASARSELKWAITSPKKGQAMQRCHEEQRARSKGARLSPLDLGLRQRSGEGVVRRNGRAKRVILHWCKTGLHRCKRLSRDHLYSWSNAVCTLS